MTPRARGAVDHPRAVDGTIVPSDHDAGPRHDCRPRSAPQPPAAPPGCRPPRSATLLGPPLGATRTHPVVAPRRRPEGDDRGRPARSPTAQAVASNTAGPARLPGFADLVWPVAGRPTAALCQSNSAGGRALISLISGAHNYRFSAATYLVLYTT